MSNFNKLSNNYKDILSRDIKFSGESADYFADYKAKFIKNYLKNNFKGQILDYGCGVGLVIKELRKYFNINDVIITGFDISNESIDKAREENSAVKFIKDDIELNKRVFDVIILANVLHHIKIDERVSFLIKISKLINKRGALFIFEHNPYNPITRTIVKNSITDKDASIIKMNELINILNNAGFSILKKSYIVFFPKILKSLRFLEPFLSSFPLGAQYACVCKLERC